LISFRWLVRGRKLKCKYATPRWINKLNVKSDEREKGNKNKTSASMMEMAKYGKHNKIERGVK